MAQGHRMFAAFWARQTHSEPPKLRATRAKVVGGATGRVLEVGVGVGTNWAYLPDGVEYSGIDPDEYMLRRAEERAREESRAIDLHPYDVEALPYEDESFDTVISTLVFCTVPHVAKGFAEVRRVLKPGGQLRFAEHVRSANRGYATFQRLAKPLTRAMAGGCEHDRDTLAAIEASGLHVEELEREKIMGLPIITGVARK